VLSGVLDRWYRRLGPRYPVAALAVAMRLPHLVLVGGVAVASLYVPMSLGEFVLLALAAVGLQELYRLLTLRYFKRRLGPLVAWIGGDHDEQLASEAWRVAASLPFEGLRLWWRGGYPLAADLAWGLLATWLLGLPAYGIAVLFGTALVGAAYGNAVQFFVMERAMAPVFDDLAGQLSDEARVEAISLPLSRRLLSALPALNVITCVVVVGVVSGYPAGLDTLGYTLLASLAVALTLTFGLSVLLSSSIVTPISRLENATRRVAAGDLATRVPVAAADETGALTGAFNRMVSGLQERERLREAFGTFVDPALAERVARDGTDLRGEEIELSVLFMDVRGFTTYAEAAPARDVVARLNALYDLVVPVILRHGGHANKFIGDGLLAVFGAPERHVDHADRAVAAALEMAASVRERYGDELRIGLGVNSGSVVVGTIGGGGRLDFTVIGDPVNTAARVESATRTTGDDLLITEATQSRLTRDHAGWVARAPIPLKGKAEEIQLFAPAVGPAEPTRSDASRTR
jgi:adenylate cyclase